MGWTPAQRIVAMVNAANVTTIADKAASLPLDKRKWLRNRVQGLSLHFEVVKSGRQMRLGDLPALLAEYGELAALLRGPSDAPGLWQRWNPGALSLSLMAPRWHQGAVAPRALKNDFKNDFWKNTPK